MEDHQHVRTSGVGHLARYKKLKDTCDMCSSAKVRCDKMKPVCSRCERLDYPCFYSPARRIRMRQRIQHISSPDHQAEAVGNSPKAAPTTTAARDKSVPTDSNASDDAADSSFQHGFSGANPFQTAKSYSSTLSSNDENNSSSSNSTKAMLLGLGYGTASDSECDCVTVAVNILQHLNAPHNIGATFPTALGGLKPPAALDLSMSSASQVIKRVSTMLICPCSSKPDVGLLAAAICAALLDTYEAILRDPTGPQAAGFSPSSEYNQRQMREAEGMEISSPVDGPSRKQAIMRILGELPKVANMIMQFTKRYGEDMDKCSRNMLQALAASIMARLRAMIDEVTSWEVQI